MPADLSRSRNPFAICESCGTEIHDGDHYMPCVDCSLCKECAPRFADMLTEPEAFIDSETEEPATEEQLRGWYDAHIARGGAPEDSTATAVAGDGR